MPIQGRQKHFSFDQVKYSGGVICLCIGCKAANYSSKSQKFRTSETASAAHTANIGLMVTESARPVLPPLTALLLGRAMQYTNLFEISIATFFPSALLVGSVLTSGLSGYKRK